MTVNGMVRSCSRLPATKAGGEDQEHAMSQKLDTSPAVIGIDIIGSKAPVEARADPCPVDC
jgi:hypothetical protein